MADATAFTLTYHDAARAGRLALLTMDNGRDHKKPTTFGAEALASLHAALDQLERDTDVKGVLLTGKPFVFAVGADLGGFTAVDQAGARAAAEAGHAAFRRLAGIAPVTLAAINGAVMGGGLEIALHCDYRTLSDSAAAIAFPEVFLSILPAWGGTQLAPRIIGGPAALQVIVHNALNNNRMLRPAQAFQLGLADRLIPSVDFLDASVALLERLVTGEEVITRQPPSTDGLDQALEEARAFVDMKVHGATRAPYLAMELIEFATRGGDLDAGYAEEADALAELLPSRQAQAAVYSFGLTQRRVRRQPSKPDVAPRPVRKVAIVGAGLMGAQLGSLFLQRLSVPLVMKDIDADVLDRARGHIEGELDQRVAKARMTAAKAGFLKSIVTYTLDPAELAGADFVVEAVLENMGLKRRIFAAVEAVVDQGAVLATNTSSLSVAGMAAGLAHPERVVGFHFFNPVAILPLVEIARTPDTSDEALATAFTVAKELKKSAIGCADTPAFVVNRILTRFMLACGQSVSKGAGFIQVDDAIKALGLPMGPFELLGLVGLKVAAHVAETMHGAYPDRFGDDVNFTLLGSSDLPGVYDWSNGKTVFPAIAEGWQVDPGATAPTDEQIRAGALHAVADEIRHMLDEGVVADARDIDTAMLLGAGWPFFMGGICQYLDQTGISADFGGPFVTATDAAA